MNKFAIALAFAVFASAPALADDLEGHCEAYAEENGTDASGCGCLAETADAGATEELLAVASPDDLDGLSDNAKAAIAACFPEA